MVPATHKAKKTWACFLIVKSVSSVHTLPLQGSWESSDEHQRWAASLQALHRSPCLEFPVKGKNLSFNLTLKFSDMVKTNVKRFLFFTT